MLIIHYTEIKHANWESAKGKKYDNHRKYKTCYVWTLTDAFAQLRALTDMREAKNLPPFFTPSFPFSSST